MFVVCMVLVLTVSACSGNEPPTVGTETVFASVCDESNKDKRVAVTGYLRLPDSFTGDFSVVLRLFETEQYSGTPIGVTARLGTEINQVENVPASYADDDLRVHLADGQIATYGTKVRVSGKMYYPSVEQDFVCGLENLLIEPAD
jgi:hypothetical protein